MIEKGLNKNVTGYHTRNAFIRISRLIGFPLIIIFKMLKGAFAFHLLSGLVAPVPATMVDRRSRFSLRGMFLDSITMNQDERL
jgi:hypothetical protein